MHPAYSVILFTTASGAGYGLLALLSLVGISHGEASSLAFGLTAMVVALALLVVAAAKTAGALLDEDSPTRHTLGVAGTLASGGFLYLIAIFPPWCSAPCGRASLPLRPSSRRSPSSPRSWP